LTAVAVLVLFWHPLTTATQWVLLHLLLMVFLLLLLVVVLLLALRTMEVRRHAVIQRVT
jgi:hypothetical protein